MFALLVMPAATAQALTARPVVSLVLTVVIALLVTWIGLSAAYYSVYPIGFFVSSLAFAVYVVTRVTRGVGARVAAAS